MRRHSDAGSVAGSEALTVVEGVPLQAVVGIALGVFLASYSYF